MADVARGRSNLGKTCGLTIGHVGQCLASVTPRFADAGPNLGSRSNCSTLEATGNSGARRVRRKSLFPDVCHHRPLRCRRHPITTLLDTRHLRVTPCLLAVEPPQARQTMPSPGGGPKKHTHTETVELCSLIARTNPHAPRHEGIDAGQYLPDSCVDVSREARRVWHPDVPQCHHEGDGPGPWASGPRERGGLMGARK